MSDLSNKGYRRIATRERKKENVVLEIRLLLCNLSCKLCSKSFKTAMTVTAVGVMTVLVPDNITNVEEHHFFTSVLFFRRVNSTVGHLIVPDPLKNVSGSSSPCKVRTIASSHAEGENSFRIRMR